MFFIYVTWDVYMVFTLREYIYQLKGVVMTIFNEIKREVKKVNNIVGSLSP